MRAYVDIRVWTRIDLSAPATIPDKTILGGRITSIPLNPFMSEDPSILKTGWNRVVGSHESPAYGEILLVLQITGIQARAGIEVCIVGWYYRFARRKNRAGISK